jgi:hypothetical protein
MSSSSLFIRQLLTFWYFGFLVHPLLAQELAQQFRQMALLSLQPLIRLALSLLELM